MELKGKNNISPFKSMLQEDIDIFLNATEMGEDINIDGKQYVGVIQYLDKDFSEEVIDDTYYSIDLIIYLKTEQFNISKRVPGKKLKLNGMNYIVNDWYTEEGMTIIKLKENSGY